MLFSTKKPDTILSTRVVITLLLFTVLAGCATVRPVMDVSESIYRGTPPTRSSSHKVLRIDVTNKAGDGEIDIKIFGNKVLPFRPATSTKETVEQDIRRYLEEHVQYDKESKKSLHITIYKADSFFVNEYSIIPGKVFFADSDCGVNIKVRFEIEEGGKVLSSYLYDDKITAKCALSSGDIAMYQKLISEYRTKFFGELDKEFMDRYL